MVPDPEVLNPFLSVHFTENAEVAMVCMVNSAHSLTSIKGESPNGANGHTLHCQELV